jgi:hypothetical protein
MSCLIAALASLSTVMSRRSALMVVPAISVMSPCMTPAAPIPECLAASDAQRRVVDTAGYLDDESYSRLDRILGKLESDTGFSVRVLTRSRRAASVVDEEENWTRSQPSNILRCGFNSAPTSSTILIVADRGIAGALDAGSSFITFPYIGDTVQFALPGVYWSRLQREYGRKNFVEKRGEAASIIVSCEQVITCLRSEEQSCTTVPPASTSFF